MFSITNNTDTSLANMEEGVIVNDSETDLVLIQVRIPDLKAEKCLQFSREERVWDVKQQILAAMPKVRAGIIFALFILIPRAMRHFLSVIETLISTR